MPEVIALICTVEELTDYANSATRTFALNISSGLTSPATPTSPLAQALLQPWTWSITGIAVCGNPQGAGIPLTATVLHNPPFDGHALDTLKSRLGKQFTDTLNLPQPNSLFNWDPAKPGDNATVSVKDAASGRQFGPWPHTVAHLSTYPAPVPHALNLVIFFQLKTADLTNINSLLAAPLFTITTPIAAYSTMNTTPMPPPTSQGSSSQIGQGWAWTYGGDASVCIVAAHQPATTIKDFPWQAAPAGATPPPALVPASINLDTLWLKPEFEDGNEDWRSTLELRLSESFDLGRQILDLIVEDSQLADNVSKNLSLEMAEALRLNVLAILRDTADFGLRYAPDGLNLLRFILARIDKPPADSDIAVLEKELATRDGAVVVMGTVGDYTSWTFILKTLNGVDPIALNPCTALIGPDGKPLDSNSTIQSTYYASLVRALRDLQILLTQEAMIASLVFAEWDAVLSASGAGPSTNALWNGIRSNVQSQLSTLGSQSGLRKRMLMGNLGGAVKTDPLPKTIDTWKSILFVPSGAGDERTQIEKNVFAAVLGYANQRLGLPGSAAGDFQSRTPLLGKNSTDAALTLSSPVQVMLSKGFTKAAAAASSIVAAGTVVAPSPKAQPAVLRVHTIEDVDDANDPLRSIAGVGMLLRESTKPAQNWSCLDAATLNVLDTSGSSLSLVPVTFAPYRLMARNGLLQAAIAYDNSPLAASSPADILGSDLSSQSDLDLNGATAYTPLFNFSFISDATLPWSTMPALKYGRNYEALAFAVRSGGALPAALAAYDGSTAPISPGLPADVTAKVPDNLATNFTYLRRTPVGPLRIKVVGDASSRPLNQSSLPAIPATVTPIARELSASDPDTDAKTLPLLLLWKSTDDFVRSKYSFEVRPPAADLEVWDRWVAGRADADKFKITRAAVRLDSALSRPKDIAAPSITNSETDTSLNDPAVVGLLFTLTQLYTTSTEPIPKPGVTTLYVPYTDLQPLADPDAIDQLGRGFALVQGNPLTVVVSELPSQAVPPAGWPLRRGVAPSDIEITVPTGAVFQLSIAPCVATGSTSWFDATATSSQFPAPDAPPAPQPAYVASTTPLEILIETARPAIISPQDVWQAVRFTAPTSEEFALSLTLDPKANPDWYLLRRAEVSRQVFRWMGRPLDLTADTQGFPSTQTAPNLNNLLVSGAPDTALTQALNWELQAFAERTDPPTVTGASLHIGAGAGIQTTQTIYTQDFATDLRAHYLRFGVTVFSRYDGLPGFTPFKAGRSISARATFPGIGTTPGGYTPWLRAFIACRIPPTSALPKPKILLCLPLTGSQANPTGSPSLLVIADEPWQLLGGLAEQLVASVQAAVRTDSNLPGSTLEIGPDPILFGSTPMVIIPPSTSGNPRSPVPWVGTPIGTTFDDVSSAPLLANTCFQFKLDDLVLAPGTQRPASWDWTMAKLQFMRTLDSSMTMDGTGAIKQATSPLTDGTWVQFLPSSLAFTANDGNSVAVRDLRFEWSTNQLQIQQVKSGKAQAISLITGPQGCKTPPPHLELWALLMSSISDAAGGAGELYLGLVNLTNGTSTSVDSNAVVDHIYLLEVQTTPAATENPYWIDSLFPGSTDSSSTAPNSTNSVNDVTHRVLRISEPIPRPTPQEL